MTVSSFLIGAVGVVLTFGTAVCVHEFGHMIFALMRGVGVHAFAIGMGPKLIARKWKGIEFSLRLLPIGGFVLLEGMADEEAVVVETEPTTEAAAASIMDPEPVKKSLADSVQDDNKALQNKGLLTRLLVMGGGVFMNFVAACIVTAVLLYVPTEFPRTALAVDYVKPGGAAEQAGFKSGDRITALNGAPVAYLDELYVELEALQTQQPEAKPEDQSLGFSAELENAGVKRSITTPDLDKNGLEAIFEDISFHTTPIIGDVSPLTPARKAGLKSGDTIMAVAGKPVASGHDVINAIKTAGEKPTEFTIKRGEETIETTITPQSNPLDASRPLIGVMFRQTVMEKRRAADSLPVAKSIGPLAAAVAMSPVVTTRHMVGLAKTQFEFITKATGRQFRENVGGPIAIFSITAAFAQEGWEKALNWFVTLNLLLIIFNLLPIPVLDGGQIVLAVIESVIRRPVPPRVLNAVFTATTWLLILFVILISSNDVLRHLVK